MEGYTHLSSAERDRIASVQAVGLGIRAMASELGRNALARGAYRPGHADDAYLLRRQRRARFERDGPLRNFVVQRLSEGWAPEQIAGRFKNMPEGFFVLLYVQFGIDADAALAACSSPPHCDHDRSDVGCGFSI